MEYEVKPEVSNGRERVKYVRPVDVFLRLLALLATLAATIVMALDKEMATFPVVLSPGLPPVMVMAPAKYSYISAFVYFLLVNAAACAYALISLVIGCTRMVETSKSFLLASSIVDLIMLVLVSTGCGAASGVGIVGIKGNSHLNWNKVCDRFERFCSHVIVAIGASAIGNIAFLLLVIVSITSLYRRSR